ncbi:unnamed protein product [Didymodactylos carnosus]|uniref:PX domain-containing protein n=1 Tax=Didymodactylos carnosus TaxID=1234261 RepID=A0A8S2D445_9BILA|nr:unnamed protein product [Didymodactylos carnosus]CAF3592272.1 unnamed protein product [Didymodactylos carnosus]
MCSMSTNIVTTIIHELAAPFQHQHQDAWEYLPYPDDKFEDSFDLACAVGDRFAFNQIYNYNDKNFVPGVPIIISIESQSFHNKFSILFNPYLYVVTIQHGSFEGVLHKCYNDFVELHKGLLKFVETETNRTIESLNK